MEVQYITAWYVLIGLVSLILAGKTILQITANKSNLITFAFSLLLVAIWPIVMIDTLIKIWSKK